MSCDSFWILSFSSATSSWPFICWTTLTLAVGFWIRPVRRVVGASPRTMIDVPSPGETAMFLGFELSFGEDKIRYSYGPKPSKRLTITNSGCQEKIISISHFHCSPVTKWFHLQDNTHSGCQDTLAASGKAITQVVHYASLVMS